VLEIAFDKWIRDFEAEIVAGSNYPRIDDDGIDMTAELTKCWLSLPIDGIERASEFFENRLVRSDGTFPVRFVILNFLFRLAHFEGVEQEWAVKDIRSVVEQDLARFVRFQEVDVLKDEKRIRWEIVNACAIRDWDRAVDLLGLLKKLDAISGRDQRALKGQMDLWSVVTLREKTQRFDPLEFLWWWVPELDRTYDVRSVELLRWGIDLAGHNEYSEDELATLSDVTHEWEVSFQTAEDLLGAYRAAWGKCYFLRHDYSKAEEQFHFLLDHGCGMKDEEDEESFRFSFYQDSAECSLMAGDATNAASLLERCAGEFPKAKGVWRKLADLYRIQASFEKAYDCLRKEMENDPSFGEDPLVSIALALGEPDFKPALRRAAELNPDHFRFMQSVVTLHWPAFNSLDQESQMEWVGGADYLWCGDPSMQFRASQRRKIAGVFADVAEGQLKRLFGRFKNEVSHETFSTRNPGPSRIPKLVQYLQGRHLSLGEMIYEIEEAQHSSEPLYRELKAWLTRQVPPLIPNWSRLQPRRLNDLRIRASHPGGSISEDEARDMYVLSAGIISAVVGA
jgi:tetratricopeptide (TPR) repeat protein